MDPELEGKVVIVAGGAVHTALIRGPRAIVTRKA